MGRVSIQDIALKPLIAMFVMAFALHWVAIAYVQQTSCKSQVSLSRPPQTFKGPGNIEEISGSESIGEVSTYKGKGRYKRMKRAALRIPNGRDKKGLGDGSTNDIESVGASGSIGEDPVEKSGRVASLEGEEGGNDGREVGQKRSKTPQMTGEEDTGTTRRVKIDGEEEEVVTVQRVEEETKRDFEPENLKDEDTLQLVETDNEQSSKSVTTTTQDEEDVNQKESNGDEKDPVVSKKEAYATEEHVSNRDDEEEDENGGDMKEESDGRGKYKMETKKLKKVPFALTDGPVPKRMEWESLEKFNQSDPFLIEYIRTYHLYPPSCIVNQMELELDDGANEAKGIAELISETLRGKKETQRRFVEIGEHLNVSETLYLEKKFNWTGLVLEGCPTQFPRLRTRHGSSWLSDLLVTSSDHPKVVCYPEAKTSKESSLNAAEEDRTQRKSLRKNLISSKSLKTTPQIEFLSVPFYTIWSAFNTNGTGNGNIDYLAIQARGKADLEEEILKTFPFKEINVQILSISTHGTQEDQKLQKVLKQQGYRKLKKFPGKRLYKKITDSD